MCLLGKFELHAPVSFWTVSCMHFFGSSSSLYIYAGLSFCSLKPVSTHLFTSGTWAPYTFFLLHLELYPFVPSELELHTPSFWNLSCVHFISPATLTWTVHLFALWKSLSCVNLFLLKLELYSRFAFWRRLRCIQWPKLLQKETGLKFQKILLKCQK